MAREESERENLLRDATAFRERVEFQVTGVDGPQIVFVGFRDEGGASFFFDQDPVFHFNSAGQLRRAFVDDRLLKAEHGELVAMRRVRRGREGELRSRLLNQAATSALFYDIKSRFDALRLALKAGEFDVRGQVAANANVVQRTSRWLENFDVVTVAPSPHAQ